MIGAMRRSRWAATSIVCLILVRACAARNPDDSAEALADRAVEALGARGIDELMLGAVP